MRLFSIRNFCLLVLLYVSSINTVLSSEPFVGEIRWVAFNFPPRGWAQCDGQLLNIAQNQALFSLLGTTYGGDGRTTFALPDMRGRVALHYGNGPGLTQRTLGGKQGSETEETVFSALFTPEEFSTFLRPAMENHGKGKDKGKGKGKGRKEFVSLARAMEQNFDFATTINNMQPYNTLNCIIALQGLFPSRN